MGKYLFLDVKNILNIKQVIIKKLYNNFKLKILLITDLLLLNIFIFL
jgi:hypothetical protein